MEGKPPTVPRTLTQSKFNQDPKDIGRNTGPISRMTPQPLSGNIYKPDNAFGIRSSSRGSFLDDINDDDQNLGVNATKNNPVNLRSLKSTVNRDVPLIPAMEKGNMSSYKPMDANNPLGYLDDDNLRKLRNKVYSKHNYGKDANDPFNDFNLQEMNNEDEDVLEKIRRLEDDVEEKKQIIQKSKMKLEKKQLYDLYEKESKLVDRLEEIKRQKEEERQFDDRLRNEIVKIKLQQNQDAEEKKRIDRMLWNVERDSKMEELIRKKLALEKIQENTKYLDDISNRRKLELEEIENAKKENDLLSAEMLQRALNHADFIQEQIESGALNKEAQALLANALSGDKNDPENK